MTRQKFAAQVMPGPVIPLKEEAEIMDSTWTEERVKKVLWLRAVEWAGLPAFVSQPFIPILFIFFQWYLVIASRFLLCILWVPIRRLYVNFTAATLVCKFVNWCKWPSIVGSATYLFFHHQPIPAVISLLWPFLAGFVCPPGGIGAIELAFAKQIGFVSQDAEI